MDKETSMDLANRIADMVLGVLQDQHSPRNIPLAFSRVVARAAQMLREATGPLTDPTDDMRDEARALYDRLSGYTSDECVEIIANYLRRVRAGATEQPASIAYDTTRRSH